MSMSLTHMSFVKVLPSDILTHLQRRPEGFMELSKGNLSKVIKGSCNSFQKIVQISYFGGWVV